MIRLDISGYGRFRSSHLLRVAPLALLASCLLWLAHAWARESQYSRKQHPAITSTIDFDLTTWMDILADILSSCVLRDVIPAGRRFYNWSDDHLLLVDHRGQRSGGASARHWSSQPVSVKLFGETYCHRAMFIHHRSYLEFRRRELTWHCEDHTVVHHRRGSFAAAAAVIRCCTAHCWYTRCCLFLSVSP